MAKCGNHDLVLVIGCASVLKRTLEVLVWFTVLAFTHIVSAQEFVTNQPAFRLLSVSNPPVTNLPTSINPLRAPSRYSASNQNLSHEPTGTFSNDINFVIPLIRFEDVPLTTAIENLARLADVNYLLDPDLEQD